MRSTKARSRRGSVPSRTNLVPVGWRRAANQTGFSTLKRTNPSASRGRGDCRQTSVQPLVKPRFSTAVRATSALSLPPSAPYMLNRVIKYHESSLTCSTIQKLLALVAGDTRKPTTINIERKPRSRPRSALAARDLSCSQA